MAFLIAERTLFLPTLGAALVCTAVVPAAVSMAVQLWWPLFKRVSRLRLLRWWCCGRGSRRHCRQRRVVTACCAAVYCVVVALLAWRTAVRTDDWRDDGVLAAAGRRVYPVNAPALCVAPRVCGPPTAG